MTGRSLVEIRTEHCLIRSSATRRQTELVAGAAEALCRAYPRAMAGLPGFDGHVTTLTLRLYRNREEFRRLCKVTDWAEAFYRAPVCHAYFPAGAANPYHWMLHEATHQLNHESAHVTGRQWVDEGLASYFGASVLEVGASTVMTGANAHQIGASMQKAGISALEVSASTQKADANKIEVGAPRAGRPESPADRPDLRAGQAELRVGRPDVHAYPVWWLGRMKWSGDLAADLREGRVIPLRAIVTSRGGPAMDKNFNLYYVEWWSLTHFLMESGGGQYRAGTLAMVADGGTLESFERNIGPVERIEREWYGYLLGLQRSLK